MTEPSGVEALRIHRAQRRQRSLDRLREAAKTSVSARKLLATVDPDGKLRYWPPEDRDDDPRSISHGGDES